MNAPPDSLMPAAPAADPDPEIAALLEFEPVRRHTRRHDGWREDHQRGFIAALARLGNVDRAAHSVGRTQSGAWTVRNSAGAEGFSNAWDAALDLFHARNPGLKPHGGRARVVRQRAPEAPAEPETEPELDDDALWAQFEKSLLAKYLLKLAAEREARLSGRIVEADFYVRQLTWLEVALDLAELGDKAIELLKGLKRGARHAGAIAATPVSVLLDQLRRAYWETDGGPARPPLAPLGHHDDEAATGQLLECQHWPERDGDGFGPSDQREAHLRRAAEAQQAWEEKARADAEAWAKREKTSSSPGFPGEGDQSRTGSGDGEGDLSELDADDEEGR